MEKWSTVLSMNKYDVGLTKESYSICLSNGDPVKLYVPRRNRAMIDAINEEIEKLEKAGFIKPSISQFAAQQFVLRNQMEVFESASIFV